MWWFHIFQMFVITVTTALDLEGLHLWCQCDSCFGWVRILHDSISELIELELELLILSWVIECVLFVLLVLLFLYKDSHKLYKIYRTESV